MTRKCHWAGMVLVVSVGTLAGCSQAMKDAFFAETVADSRSFHKEAATALDKHDYNMGEQHIKMHPEAEAGIRQSRAGFEAEMVEVNNRFDAIHSSMGDIITELAMRFADLGAGTSIMGEVGEDIGTATEEVRDVTSVARTAMMVRFNENIENERRERPS